MIALLLLASLIGGAGWLLGSAAFGTSRDNVPISRRGLPARSRAIAGSGDVGKDSDDTPMWTALDDLQLTRLLKGPSS